MPRFQGDNFTRNIRLLERIKSIASEIGVTPAQLALSWVLAQGKDIVPIFGTKKLRYLEENLGAAKIQLTADHIARIEEAAPMGATAGSRYPEEAMRVVNR